jgi:arylsulfatase A-like enzyme
MSARTPATLLFTLLTAATLACQGTPAESPAPSPRPNVVLFLVDDLGWADLAVQGSTFYETPNVDRLAASGMRFTDAYAASPVCSPTRAALMTGRHPVRVGITDWIPGADPRDRKLLGPDDRHELPLEETTLAEELKAAGYATFFAGKWHLGDRGFFPEDQGFDVNIGGHHRGSPPGGYYAPYENPKLEDGPDGEYLTDRLAAETIRFIEEQTEQRPGHPFLAMLSFYTVHTPIQASRTHIGHFQAKAAELRPGSADEAVPEHEGWTIARQANPDYASMVKAMDENVGRVLEALDRLGIGDDTVVVFTSDNGGLSTLERKNAPTSNLPLRSGKGWCYEGGLRVPAIIRAPGVTRPGSTSAVPVVSMDVYPTVLELAGLPLRPERHVDGRSLVPLLTGGDDALDREALYWHFPHYHGSTWTPGAAIRAGDWKLIELDEYDAVELYNLKDDLGEGNELSAEHPEKTAELLAELHAWQQELAAKKATPNPNAP